MWLHRICCLDLFFCVCLQDEAEVAEVEMLLEAYTLHLDTTYNKLQVGCSTSVFEALES